MGNEDARETPPGVKRLLITFTVVIGILAGVPVWRVSTNIHRAKLPTIAIEESFTRAQLSPLLLPKHLHVIFAVEGGAGGSSGSRQLASEQWLSRADAGAVAQWVEEALARELETANMTASQRVSEASSFRVSVALDDDSCRRHEPPHAGKHSDSGTSSLEGAPDSADVGAGVEACGVRRLGGGIWPCGLGRAGVFGALTAGDTVAFDSWLHDFSLGGHRDLQPGSQCEPDSCPGTPQHGDSGHYTILMLVPAVGGSGGGGSPPAWEGAPAVTLGGFRHAWVTAPSLDDTMLRTRLLPAVASLAAELFDWRGFGGGGDVGGGVGTAAPLAADGSAILSFSLLNADPRDWIYDWDFEAVQRHLLAQVLAALQPVARFTVESQVLYHTPKGAAATWSNRTRAYEVAPYDWPFFVNSREWHLDTSAAAVGRSKVLHFVVYIPAASECPLRLRLPGGALSPTGAFSSPSWGGVVILNPPQCGHVAGDADVAAPGDGTPHCGVAGEPGRDTWPALRHLSAEHLAPTMGTFVAQLRSLLGLPPGLAAGTEGVARVPAVTTGVAGWEVDVLLRRFACRNEAAAAETLRSLSELVRSLPGMVVKDEIGRQAAGALEQAARARAAALEGEYANCSRHGRAARALAEEAFFDPSMMALLYFPLEHHLAVYTPFFLPVILHASVAFLKELARYRKELKKYEQHLRQL